MKQYIKDSEVKYANQISIIKDGLVTLNPSEEEILKDGWVEYTPKVPTEEEIFQSTLSNKLSEIEYYDKSDDVNIFYYQDKPMWLTREDRMVIGDRFERELAKGVKTTHLTYKGESIEVTPEQGIALVNMVKEYADKCFDVTQMHMFNVNKLTTADEINAYDYKTGYPEKLKL